MDFRIFNGVQVRWKPPPPAAKSPPNVSPHLNGGGGGGGRPGRWPSGREMTLEELEEMEHQHDEVAGLKKQIPLPPTTTARPQVGRD
ncbi:hypothetical protein KSP39_PZI001021 [Platanthera zijinensis]|uniref:Uncharacterized protein n=1 Tax=Platanthera zijinensis TaxID=2320716 RepID=A0AAP0C1T2_9ASPA